MFDILVGLVTSAGQGKNCLMFFYVFVNILVDS